MSDPPKPLPATTPRGAAVQAARRERLAAALRANLGRRKAQARHRAADADPPADSDEPG
jgi:hypothetical protein